MEQARRSDEGSLTDSVIEDCARLLANAELHREPVNPLTDSFGPISIADAYRIQLHNVERRRAAGDDVVGMKAGLTSRAMQELLGVEQPDFGHLFTSMSVANGTDVELAECLQPRIEAEVAVILDADLRGDRVTVEQVRRATGAIVPALEIVDSRVAGWRITIADTIADNASSGKFVIGAPIEPSRSIDPRLIGVVLANNGEMVGCGVGAAALGNPFAGVAWLAETMTMMGSGLRAGQTILPGAVHAMVPVAAGDHFVAEFGGLGSVEVGFVDRDRPIDTGSTGVHAT